MTPINSTRKLLDELLPGIPEKVRQLMAASYDAVDWGPLPWLATVLRESNHDLLSSLRHASQSHQRAWDLASLLPQGEEKGRYLADYWKDFTKAEFYHLLILSRLGGKSDDLSFHVWAFMDAANAAAYWQTHPDAPANSREFYPSVGNQLIETLFQTEVNS